MSNTEQTKRAWKRTLLGVVFAGMCMAMAVLEVNALRVLRKGQEFESQSLYRTAAMAYGMVVEKYAFSFSVVRAKEGLDRIAPVLEDGGQVDRFHHSTIQSLMGSRFSPYEMDFAPLVFSLLAAVLFMALLSSPQGRQRRWLSLMT